MAFNRIDSEILWRTAFLFLTLALLCLVLTATHWYVTAFLLSAAALYETWALARAGGKIGRELKRFFEAIAFDDATQNFSRGGGASGDLDRAMAEVMERFRQNRAEREEQARYLQALLVHIPVALLSRDADGEVQLLNPAARRLFEGKVRCLADCARYGEPFVTGLTELKPGDGLLLRMECPHGPRHLKAAATEFASSGHRRTIVSLQNIDSELSARELMAWQSVIRTMTHEVMNSLTPISSLAATAGDIVAGVRDGLPSNDPNLPALNDAVEALETVARRSAGLMRFVQDHRRITHQLTAQPERLSVRRVFARLERLLAADLSARGIALSMLVEPETLEVNADGDLLDQALINLLRNAMDALAAKKDGRIALSGRRGEDGAVLLAVADNGPGIPAKAREKIFVPFYTTKRQGTGVGLTLVRQIAAVHGGEVAAADTPGGGATFVLRL